jgi:hypothetical protein
VQVATFRADDFVTQEDDVAALRKAMPDFNLLLL